MSSREVDLVRPLLDEIVEWVLADVIFHVPAGGIASGAYVFNDGQIPFHRTGTIEWFSHIDINNEDSAYVALMDLTKEATGILSFIHQFGPEDVRGVVDERYETVWNHILHSSRVEQFARNLHKCDPIGKTSWEEDIEVVHTTLSSHFSAIMSVRAASLSKRHAPMEALFAGYRSGLFPYGWDWEALLCLDPELIG